MSVSHLDLITMGRAAVDLYAEQLGSPLEDASTFSKYVGGCPANIAIGASRLGLRTGMITRVGDEAMGRFVKKTLEQEGVDTTYVATDPQRLTGLVLLGVNPPDQFPLIFYRENCADMAITSEDFDETVFERSRAFLITGTHFSKGGIAKVSQRAVRMAKAAGCAVVVDVDYRPVLWGVTGHGDGESRYVSTKAVAERLKSTLRVADLIVGTDEELRIAVAQDDIHGAIAKLREMTQAVIIRKRGGEGCVVYLPDGTEVKGTPYSVKVLNVLGAGDAFMSGFLRGWLRGKSWDVCASWGNACGALVVSRHGCAPGMPFWEEMQRFVEEKGTLSVPTLAHVHFSLGRRHIPRKPLAIVAFDHRTHFEALSNDKSAIQQVKRHIFDAMTSVAPFDLPFQMGVIADHQYSGTFLPKAAEKRLWTAVCLERPNLSPLQFLDGKEAAYLLRSWPKAYTVKALARSTHDGAALQNLWDATRQWGHELLVEVIPSGTENVISILECFYGLGIRPDWWKLPFSDDHSQWENLRALLSKEDPYCRGVLLLGQGATLESLVEAFDRHRHFPIIKGFAVGRTIWGDAAQEWLRGERDERALKEEVWTRYRTLIEAWCGVSTVTM